MRVYPPFIEYESPQVEVKVALPHNLSEESSIRFAMMKFVEAVQDITSTNEEVVVKRLN